MILAFKIFLLSWLITNYPLISNWIDDMFKDNNEDEIIANTIYEIFSCHKCLSFTLILIITMNIWYAIIFAIIAKIIQ